MLSQIEIHTDATVSCNLELVSHKSPSLLQLIKEKLQPAQIHSTVLENKSNSLLETIPQNSDAFYWAKIA
jgi:transposase-like protein